MGKCPLCKKEIDEKAGVCPYCTRDISVSKNPGCMFAIIGLVIVGIGILLIWMPLGIPMILIGLVIAAIGLGKGMVKAIGK